MTAPAAFDPVQYKATTRKQWDEAAEAWHRWGPTLHSWLGPATEVMMDLAGIGPGSRVLDVAAGAGEQTLMIAARVGPTGYVLATDLSQGVLRFAAEQAASRGFANVETRVLDGENLDLPDDAFDAVVSRVGLIYFPDQQKALTGMRRVLKPGGRICAVVYSTADRNPFFSLPVGIIRRRANLGPPLPGQPGPFSLGANGVLAEAYQRAGFRDPSVEILPAPLRMPSSAECLRFEKESFGALHQMLSGLDDAGKAAAWAEVAEALKQFDGPAGFTGPCEMVVAAATK